MTDHGCLISQVDIGSDPMKFQTIRLKHLLHLFNLQDPSPEFLSGGIAQSGRAPALQAGGRGFDPHCLHHAGHKLIAVLACRG